MDIVEKSTSPVDSAVDVLSGKLKDILVQKEKGVFQVDSDCILVEAAKKMRDNKVWSFNGSGKWRTGWYFY